MALTEHKILKIKVDYEIGKLSRSAIGKKHRISQPTLRKHAEEGQWEYKKNFKEVSEIVEQKSIERLIEKEVDRATKITDQFLNDINEYRRLSMNPALEIKTAMDEAKNKSTEETKIKVSKDEYDRIFAGAKINKICLEALNVGYIGARKALGMDKDEGKTDININLDDRIKIRMDKLKNGSN